MTETLEVRFARLEEKFSGLAQRLDAHHELAEAERKQVRETLAEVVNAVNKWAGVRSGLLGIGIFMSTIAAVGGAVASYLFHKS